MRKLGRLEIATVRDGLFRLDGGAMFGIVPKPVWEKIAPADERNRIVLSLNPLLVRAGEKNILVDTGIGNKHDAQWNDMFGIDHRWSVPDSLRALGLSTSDIDFVVPSHMHFDHMGGATVRHAGGLEPTFPRATFLIQEREWEAAFDSNPRTKGSYRREDFVPLERAGRVRLIHGDEEVAPGVRIAHTGAHTQGHQIVILESDGQKAVYPGDLMPTVGHLKPAWCMGYDLDPYAVAKWKQEFLERAVREDWIVIFDHDTSIAMGRVRQENGTYRIEPVARLEG